MFHLSYRVLIRAVMVGGCWLSVASCNAAEPPTPSRQQVVVTELARRLHADCLVFDGHNDLPYRLREDHGGRWENLDIARSQPAVQTDIPRLRMGGVGALFWSAYVPSDTLRTGTALRDTLEQIDLIHDLIRHYPDDLELALSAADVERIHRAGKIASLIGLEGGHSIQDSLGALRQLYQLGARYMTLTHADSLAWADAATDTPRAGGLSAFGEEVVREMNRLGMLVDISHVAPETMHAVLRVSRAPIIASHSSARALADHPRNVPDDVLRQIKTNGGVVMVNFFSGFVVPESARNRREMFDVRRRLKIEFKDDEAGYKAAWAAWEKAHPLVRGSVHDVVDHIDHIVRTAGVEHVGLGSDFDGVAMTPAQLDDVASLPTITQELLNRQYTPEQIKLILGGNTLRVLREAERVAGK